MWARVVEIMLGCWLALSPFIFRHGDNEPLLWIVDFSAAVAVITIGMISYWPRVPHLHLLTCLVAIGLCLFGYFGEPHPVQPALKNDLIVGLLLLMFGLIPNHASRQRADWEEIDREGYAAWKSADAAN